eukprot:TRINITY_DN28020_c0_g1_i1.p1 TRINITY_DN28020_c0_g1~~TRINITY_DN28020_c0_g1_i1.p1  ORF type:complete len:350 (+),score=86.20 TRINITY_DN28020_c0_g1_i1:68-1117(+)
MTFSTCTKYTGRRDPPVHLGTRCADPSQRRTRAEVEPTTHGKVFWGDMPNRVWGTSNKIDYPTRGGGKVDPDIVKNRAQFMRSGSIKLGDAAGKHRVRRQMQELDRDHYVARVMYRKGDTHSKTKSELYVCPSEVQEWKTRHLETMSKRQFTGEGSGNEGTGATVEARNAVRKEMLGSHFCLGEDGKSETGQWLSRTREDFAGHQPPSHPASAAAKHHPTESSLSLSAPDISPSTPSFPSRLKQTVIKARPKSAGAARTDTYSNICKDAAPQLSSVQRDATSNRASQHRTHSWRLGYDDNANRFVTQQRVFFRPVSYTCSTEQKASYLREKYHARRDSQQRMFTSSVCF